MRFIIAALAAFLVLMLDVDRSPSSINIPTVQAPAFSHDTATDAVPFAARFIESADAGEAPGPTVEDAIEPRDAAAEPQASAIETFCHSLQDAAQASEIPVAFFARLIW